MKHIRHLALSLMTSALAAEVPVSLVVENLNGQQRIVKTYELPPRHRPGDPEGAVLLITTALPTPGPTPPKKSIPSWKRRM